MIDSCMAGQTEGPLPVALGFIHTACTGYFGNLFSLDGYLAQHRYGREGLGPSPQKCALLLCAVGEGGWVSGVNGRRGGSGNLDWFV